ncbi:hypothetical protein [Stutzerimonas stutzeri]|uniref:hypothetical protein n=1 Tax=Stutzerimonas stutzeri TaxID=316 RepID=UPI001CFCE6A2|nr:hypothetical protein [Stutzerimonas stutzeri]
MKYILALCLVALLAACDAGTTQSNVTVPPLTTSYFYKDTIYFPDGAGFQFNGKLRRYEFLENEKGQFDRYTFEFPEDMMAVEGAVFATLAKSGYQRKVRRENDKVFVVNYSKKGFSPVSMTYERLPTTKQKKAFTRLKIIWKNA